MQARLALRCPPRLCRRPCFPQSMFQNSNSTDNTTTSQSSHFSRIACSLQARMRGLAILPPPPGDEAPLFEHVCATVLQQSHLCPVPLEYQVGGWVGG